MASHALFMTFIYFFILTLCKNVHANLEFKPENNGQVFSDNMAYGIIYGFYNNSEVLKENAAIFCTNSKLSYYIKLEFILVDEPPKSLLVEIMNDYLSLLQDSTIFCSVSQILDINKWSDEKQSGYYTGKTGKVSYQSKGTQNITIELSGLKLRKETATHTQGPQSQASISYRKDECIKDVWDGEGDDSSKYPKLGKNCTENKAKRWMLNSNKELECGQCCSKNFWSIKMKTCRPCATQNEPNVWTNCEYDYKNHMIKPTILSPTEQSRTSTTTSTTTNSKTSSTELPKEPTAEGKNNGPKPTTDSAGITTELLREITAKGENSISESIPSWPGYYWIFIIIGGVFAAVLGVLAFCCFKKRGQQSSTARFSRGGSGINRPPSNPEVNSIPEVIGLLEDEDGTVEITR